MNPENMRIWDEVSTTDPEHTKHVSQRGGFTAIDAHYQIMSATQQFGPIGQGWGFVSSTPIFHDKFVIVPVILWHGDRSNDFGPIYGCAEMLGNRADADAPKKATTDAITKGLSLLGFNADVFLGMFDDNKYVQGLKDRKKSADQADRMAQAVEDIAAADSLEALSAVWSSYRDLQGNPAFQAAKNDRKHDLSVKDAA
jgi:hypothetical protein